MKPKTVSPIFLLILAISFLIRLPGIFQTASIDEDGWLSLDYWDNWHPPVSIMAHSFASWLLGGFSWVSKLLVLLVGCANLTLTYLVSKKLLGQKPAFFAAGLMGLGAYPTLAALQIDIDGSFLLFGYLLTTLFFLNYEEKKEKKWLLFSGLGLGLCILTKYPGIFILPILALYHLVKNNKFWETVKVSLALMLIGLALFSIFPLVSYLTGSSFFTDTINHFTRYTVAGRTNISLLLMQYLLSIIWMGPLFIGLLALSLTKPKKANLLPYLWISVIFLAYTFLNKDNFKPIERYFTLMVAPLAIIGGSYLSKLKLTKMQWVAVAGGTIIFAMLFGLLNLSGAFVPFYPKTSFFERAVSGVWNFYLPISGSSGPIGFFMNFRILAISFISMTILVPRIMILKKKQRSMLLPTLLILFLSISLAYNLFLTQEFLFSTTSPSVDKISKQIIGYADTNELKEPVYIFRNKALRYYFRDEFQPVILDFDIEKNATLVDDVISNSGTIILVDFPKLNEDSLFWKRVMKCNHLAEFSDKGVKMGYILDCSNLRNEVIVG